MNTMQYLAKQLALACLLLSVAALGGSLRASATPDQISKAQPDVADSATEADPTSPAQITRRVEDLAAERAGLALQIQQQGEDPASSAQLVGMEERLGQIELLLKAQLDLAELLALQPEARAGDYQDEPSLSQLNTLYEEVAAIGAAIREQRTRLEATKERLQSLDSRVRETRVALADASKKNRAQREKAVQGAELAAREVREQVFLATLELTAAQRKAGLVESLEARIADIRDRIAYGDSTFDGAIAPLLERERSLQRTKAEAERRLATADMRLAAAKQRYAQNSQPPAELLTVVEALTAYRDAIGQRISLANSELERLVSLRDIWRHWDALLRTSYTEDELAGWQELAANQLTDTRLDLALRRGEATDLELRLQGLETRISQLPEDSQTRRALQETVQVMHHLQSDLGAAERLLAADIRLIERFSDDLAEITGNVGLVEILTNAWKSSMALWHFEIAMIDDAPFTVGSLIMGLLLFAVGLWASRLGATAIGRVAIGRLKLDAGAAHAIQTFSFYAMLATFTMLALRTIHFPLTAFAFLGGALAIGIGFGSQNVMNNFISGLILMLERPVRAQDVVEIDGAHGVIQKIGPRSTQIRSTDGRHIVVPNSFFLESNVVNWTLSDDLMRTKVSVGVAYGSPTRQVKQLIEDAITAEPLVLNTPPANVIFDAFADNSLNFDVYFWVTARSPMGVKDVESRIRFRIDDLLREHNITIAFPQRDVHLDAGSPIEVRMVNDRA